MTMKAKRELPSMKTDKEYNDAHDALERAGWTYLGAGYFRDPLTDTRLLLSTAFKVMVQRTKREAILKGIKIPKRKPRLVMCDDWRGIVREMKRQLKPYGLTVRARGNYEKWGDALDWQVLRLPDPEYEKYRRACNEKGIDPWNCYV